MDEYYRAVRQLPAWLAQLLGRFPSETAAQVQEIRLRAGHGVCFTMQGCQTPLQALPACPAQLRQICLTQLQLDEIFHTLCGGAVHAHQTELAQGFLTTASGCRVGIAGKYVDREGQSVLQQVHSINMRIARAVCTPLPEQLCGILQQHFTGMLLAGEPGSGKTTLLRQMAAHLAAQHRRVAVVDERGELFPLQAGQPLPEVDVISGIPKAAAVQMALRTLAPQAIVLDELGTLEETQKLEQGFFSGVDFIASVHAASRAEALRRPQVRYLQQHQMLQILVVLQGSAVPGKICEICML